MKVASRKCGNWC